MLAANVCAADFIERAKHPALFRVHEGPTPEKRQILSNYLRTMGVTASLSDDPKPAELQAIAQSTRDRPDAAQIHQMLLRSMQQAIYTPVNSGHFGLAYDAYAHFTSPIRRYPDLLVHRVLKALLQAKRYHWQAPGAEAAAPARGRRKISEGEAWEAAGVHCSANERRADEASRDVEAWLKCKFMRERLGEEYSGTISAVTTFGVFVQLDELYVEGLVHVTELGGEYYRFDEARQELRGERTGVRYAVGGRVRVQVSRVDLDGRKIDFRMVREGGLVASRAGGGKERGETAASRQLAELEQTDRLVKKRAGRKAPAKAGTHKPQGGGGGGGAAEVPRGAAKKARRRSR